MRRLTVLPWLFASAVANADPAPVFARVSSIAGNQHAELRVEQDVCYTWGTPSISVSGTAISVTQTVTPIPACTESRVSLVRIELGPYPSPRGTYRLTYTPQPVGFGPMPVSVVEFVSRPASGFQSEPFEPVALEPIQMHFSLLASCDAVAGVRLIEGGVRIEIDRFEPNAFICDDDAETSVTIGAFPPGTYRVELAYLAEDGGELMRTTDVVVRPGHPAPGSGNTSQADLSGLWYGLGEEPSTGLSIIHTRGTPNAGAPAQDALIAIWYRYEANGRPVWYWVEAPRAAGFRTFSGVVLTYSPSNPTAMPWQRQIEAEPVGTFTIRFTTIDQPARVDAEIDGRAIDFSVQRLRWQRAAWPPYVAPVRP